MVFFVSYREKTNMPLHSVSSKVKYQDNYRLKWKYVLLDIQVFMD
jgi:hypothetical protein